MCVCCCAAQGLCCVDLPIQGIWAQIGISSWAGFGARFFIPQHVYQRDHLRSSASCRFWRKKVRMGAPLSFRYVRFLREHPAHYVGSRQSPLNPGRGSSPSSRCRSSNPPLASRVSAPRLLTSAGMAWVFGSGSGPPLARSLTIITDSERKPEAPRLAEQVRLGAVLRTILCGSSEIVRLTA